MISVIRGKFTQGVLNGLAQVMYTDRSQVQGLAVNNTFHGIVRHLDVPFSTGRRKRYVKREAENALVAASMFNKDDPISEVIFAGNYRNGYIDGPGWKFLVGGGYLFGNFHKSTTFTTNEGAFINQDLESAYVGRFVDGKMMAGQVARVTGQRTVDSMKVVEFSEPTGTVYKYAPTEEGTMTDPLVTDITEDTWVHVKESSLGPEVGQGLFAKQDIPDNTVVAFFGGLRYTINQFNESHLIDPDYWTKCENNIIHLPDELGKDTSKYKATLGHKINHSFSKW
jgi:histone-lysine N-methyltransferase SETD7